MHQNEHRNKLPKIQAKLWVTRLYLIYWNTIGFNAFLTISCHNVVVGVWYTKKYTYVTTGEGYE